MPILIIAVNIITARTFLYNWRLTIRARQKFIFLISVSLFDIFKYRKSILNIVKARSLKHYLLIECLFCPLQIVEPCTEYSIVPNTLGPFFSVGNKSFGFTLSKIIFMSPSFTIFIHYTSFQLNLLLKCSMSF